MTDRKFFLVIDGSSMLVTNYYGNLPKQILFEKDEEKKKLHYSKIMQTSDGTYTNAIYGTLRTILKIIREQKPTHMAVVFDKSRDTFRREMYADYKGTRGATPEPLKQQFVLIEEVLGEIGLKVLFDDNYEADDLAGSIISKFEGPDMPMAFLTKDHDYLQLVSEYTRGWMVQTKKEKAVELFEKYNVFGDGRQMDVLPDKVFEFTSEHVLSEEGVLPSQIPDLKGICGDTSDNIPGVKGVSSAAAPLIREYGSVEGIYEELESFENEKEQKKLAKFWKENLGVTRSPIKALLRDKESALLSKKLATIVRDVPVPSQLEDYECNINNEALDTVLRRLEFKSMVE
ncbi:MAG: 5'-3' exonuclease H3TH domain-containing protein [Agathobacter sp.]|nr:5'-3' exonuclease H3TH domain-containing protein [Agathobacter sp.]